MKLSRSIRGKMTISYAGLILALVITFSFIYYDYASSILIERASQSLSQLSTTTNSNFDSLIRNLDSTAYRIVSSSLIKEAFYKDCSTVYEMLENKNSLMDLLFTTTGSQIENQINLIGKNGKLVEFGQKFDTSYFNSTMQPKINFKIQECLDSKGSIYISSTPLFSSTNENSTIFSVCRGFNKTFGANYDACVEIQLNYNTIAKLMDSVLKMGTLPFTYMINMEHLYIQNLISEFHLIIIKKRFLLKKIQVLLLIQKRTIMKL